MKSTLTLIPALLLLALASPPVARAFDGCHAADVDGNGVVNFADVQLVILNEGLPDPRLDLDGSGVVDEPDWLTVVDFFELGCPSCPGDLDEDGDVDADDRALLELDIAADPDCRFDVSRDGWVDSDEDADICIFYYQNPSSPPALRCDFDGNEIVNFNDVYQVILRNGMDCRADLSKDGKVDTTDIWFLLASWGPCPESF